MPHQESANDFPGRRVVLIGASNLLRGIDPLVDLARQVWGQPLDVLAALGHGRSYGLRETRVLIRSLPGILRCGLWEALASRPQAPTATLVTDIGNDLLYDVPVAQIRQWVQQCLCRCSAFSQRFVVTELPLASISRIRRWQFLLLRSAFFPGSRLRWEDAVERARQLNQDIQALAQRYGAVVVRPRVEWYGFDPIHIRYSAYPAAWHTIFSHWRDANLHQEQAGSRAGDLRYERSLRRWLYLRSLRPEQRRLGLSFQFRSQPSGQLRDGSRLSFY